MNEWQIHNLYIHIPIKKQSILAFSAISIFPSNSTVKGDFTRQLLVKMQDIEMPVIVCEKENRARRKQKLYNFLFSLMIILADALLDII